MKWEKHGELLVLVDGGIKKFVIYLDDGDVYYCAASLLDGWSTIDTNRARLKSYVSQKCREDQRAKP